METSGVPGYIELSVDLDQGSMHWYWEGNLCFALRLKQQLREKYSETVFWTLGYAVGNAGEILGKQFFSCFLDSEK